MQKRPSISGTRAAMTKIPYKITIFPNLEFDETIKSAVACVFKKSKIAVFGDFFAKYEGAQIHKITLSEVFDSCFKQYDMCNSSL